MREYKEIYGVEIPEEEQKTDRISYATLSKMFDAVLCNNIVELDYFYETLFEQESAQKREIVENMSDEELLEELENYSYSLDLEKYDIETDRDDLEDLLIEKWQENPTEIFQYYIVSDNAKEIIERFTDDLVVYYEPLDIDVWCITHWGTMWSGVPVRYNTSEVFKY